MDTPKPYPKHADSMLVSRTMKKRGQTDLQIRGLPTALRDKVRLRAKRKGQTMSQYLIEILEREHAQPSLEEWLEEILSQPRTALRGDPAQAVREAREEREEQLAANFRRIRGDRARP